MCLGIIFSHGKSGNSSWRQSIFVLCGLLTDASQRSVLALCAKKLGFVQKLLNYTSIKFPSVLVDIYFKGAYSILQKTRIVKDYFYFLSGMWV